MLKHYVFSFHNPALPFSFKKILVLILLPIFNAYPQWQVMDGLSIVPLMKPRIVNSKDQIYTSEYFNEITFCKNTSNIEISDSSYNKDLSLLQIGGQFLGGAAAGAIISVPLYPYFYSYAGWFIGSSLGVYLIGNIGPKKSSYAGTLLGGLAGSAISIAVFNDNETFQNYDLLTKAILISIPCEILCFYLFRSNDEISIGPENNKQSFLNRYQLNNLKKLNYRPDFSIQLININF